MCPVFAISLGKPLNLSCFTCKMAEPKLCECRSEVECYSTGTHTHTQRKPENGDPLGGRTMYFDFFTVRCRMF